MINPDAQREKIESLSTTDHAFDVLSGGIVRLYARLEEVEAESQAAAWTVAGSGESIIDRCW
jgi:hypothetical protein